MYISRLVVKNWRNFTNVDVPLKEIVYIAGVNASGKSNFLDIFRFLRDIVTRGGGLQKAVDDRGGVPKIRCLAARQHSAVKLEVELKKDLTSEVADWSYCLSFHDSSRIKQQGARVVSEIVKKNGETILDRSRESEEDKKDPWRLTQTHLEQIGSNQKFREIAEFFKEVLYLHLVPQLLRHGNQLAVKKMESDPFGQGFLEMVAVTPEKTRANRLKRINEILQNAVPELHDLTLEKDESGNPHLEILFKNWRATGARQREDQFSDGTLRLIALLWSLMSTNNLILLEEPELSLHGAVIEQIPSLFLKTKNSRKKSGGQIFVSTHSERLLSDKSIDASACLIVSPRKKGEASRVEMLNDMELNMVRMGMSSPADLIFPKTEAAIGRLF